MPGQSGTGHATAEVRRLYLQPTVLIVPGALARVAEHFLSPSSPRLPRKLKKALRKAGALGPREARRLRRFLR